MGWVGVMYVRFESLPVAFPLWQSEQYIHLTFIERGGVEGEKDSTERKNRYSC